MNRLFLIDAYALIFRSYYAFIARPMRNGAGMNTSAVFGFTKFLRDIIVREKPHYLGVAFDPRGGTFRNRLYPDYKANRPPMPEDIALSVPYIKRIVDALRIPVLEVPDFEADDVIGTLSHKAAAKGFDVMMVTPDKDYGQLVTDHIKIYKQSRTGEGIVVVGPEQIKEQYGFDDPRRVIDLLALWGDASDNIPGVAGIGEKGAMKLIGEFGSVDNMLAHPELLKGKQRERIVGSEQTLRMAIELATIRLDVPVEFEPEKLVMEQPDCGALREIYAELDFNMFLRELDSDRPSPFKSVVCGDQSVSATGNVKATEGQQTDLFGSVVAPRATKSAKSVAADDAPTADLFSQAADYGSIHSVDHSYVAVTDSNMIETIVTECRRRRRFAFDCETTGFDPFTARLVSIAVAVESHKAWFVPLDNPQGSEWLALLKPLFEDRSIEKVGQNIKFDILMLRAAGVEVGGFKYDTMLLHYLLDAEREHNMNYLARTELHYQPVEIESLIGRGQRQITMDRVPIEQLTDYAAEDADVTWQLYEKLWPRVVGEGFGRLYRTVEEPLIDVLASMEWTGVKIDSEQLHSYGVELNETMRSIEEQIRTIASMPDLNLNSSRQLGVALFEVLKVDAKPKRTKTKQYSTDEEYLQSLADRHEVIPMILEYRGIKKLLSTYVEALPLLVNKVTGRIHTSYNQAVTATGRLSSTNPNLQNIPVRDALGRPIRKAFVASDQRHTIVAADYSQVELRLMAHLSGDENMIAAFKAGEDIHRDTASRLFKVAPDEVTPEQRRKAKTANFGIIYGISAFGLRQRIEGITMTEAKQIIDGYFESYPKVREYMNRVTDEAHQRGYVETLYGRRRYLPDIASANANARSLAERNAINAPIQGSAADIIKLAMNEIAERFKAEGIKSQMIMQVHDELVIDTLKEEVERVKQIVKSSMEGVAQLSVPLTVEVGEGSNWLEAH